jgi:cytoplasmic iron level regulating protein YaaA (DUF328/UPF0246 family)
MLTILSPAKTLDPEPQRLTKKFTIPELMDDSQELIDILAKKSKAQVAKLMGLSEKLATLNVERYRTWNADFSPDNAKQALLMFKGDVYQGFDCERWKGADFTFAQKHLRILSGLHGVLRPLDLIQPYRLEMGTKLKTKRGQDLYDFWGDQITLSLQAAIRSSNSQAFVNLASNEYFSAVEPTRLTVPIVTPVFKDKKNGQYKIIGFFAKRARGMMANFIIRQQIKDPAGLRKFNVGGYRFDKASSDDEKPVFLRDEQ